MAKPKPQEPVRKRKRRRRGVPKSLTIVLLILALGVGGCLGYWIGGKSQSSLITERDTQIANATGRIQDLEAAIERLGGDPNAEVFDGLSNTVDPETVSALAGEDGALANNTALVDDSEDLTQPASTTAATVVAEFGGIQVMSDEVLAAYNATVNRLLMQGLDVSDYADSLLDETLASVVAEKVKYQKAEELGLTTLTAEDEAAIDAQAQATYEEDLEFYLSNDGTMTDEEARQSAIARYEEDGNTLESLRASLKQTWWERKLEDYVTSAITVTEEQLQETYDQYLTDQRELYDGSPEEYELARRYADETIVYNPAGYRTFKQVLIAFDMEDGMRAEEIRDELSTLDATEDADQIALLNGELDALYAKLAPTAEEVLDRIAQGTSFDALITEYDNDPEQELESVRKDGYYVCANSPTYDAAITEAAMALAKVGDVSDAIRTTAGLHILYYNSDVTAGAVPLENVREALTAEVLESLKYDAYDEQLTQWVEEANVVYHREALQ